MPRGRKKAAEPKKDNIVSTARAIEPEVKENPIEKRAREFEPEPKQPPKRVLFRMNGGSINPIIDGKRYNIRSEKIGVEKVPDGNGNMVFGDVWAYSTAIPEVIEYLKNAGYKEVNA